MSNIQTFNARSVAATPKINNVSAGKNLVNINLTNANLKQQEANKGAFDQNIAIDGLQRELVREYTFEELMAFDEEINTNLSESDLKGKSLEEILKEGQETHEEVILARNQAAAQEAIDAIDDIGKVNLDSAKDINEAIEAYNALTPEQKALVPQEKLDEIAKATAELERLQIEEAKRKAEEEARKRAEAEKNRPWYEKAWDAVCDAGATVATFTASVIEGVVDVAETIVDGAVQVVGGGVACVVGLIDEEAGDAMKQGIQDFVSYDASGAMYDAWVDMSGIDPEIAYGWAHTAGNITGQVIGYATISMIPGGAVVTATAGGFASAGAAAESAYANGATFEEAMVVSTVSGVTGAVTGGAANKLKGAAAGAKTISQVAGYTGAGAVVGSAEPIVNSGVEYLTYGNNDGKSYVEFMNESGGWLKIGMGATSGAISTGGEAFGTYNARRKSVNYFANDPEVKKWYPEETGKFQETLEKVDAMADKYANEGIMSRKDFYKVWGAENKPEPSKYLSEDYIRGHLAIAQNEGVSRFTSADSRSYHEANGQIGYSSEYSVGDNVFKNGSEFMTNSNSANDILSGCSNSDDLARKLNVKPYKGDVYRYDIPSSTEGLNIRMPSGNEPGAYKFEWIPGGYTLDGGYEVVIDGIEYDKINVSRLSFGGN